MKPGPPLTPQAAEELAIQALTFIAGDPERLARFLNETGIGAAGIRDAAGTPGFLAGVVEYVSADEKLLTDFAAEAGIDPARIGQALRALGGGAFEGDGP
jgi:Protein of unknown function (DUF3572)